MNRIGMTKRPRPRVESGPNPALQIQQSPYGDGSRTVPNKLGMRAQAASRLRKKR